MFFNTGHDTTAFSQKPFQSLAVTGHNFAITAPAVCAHVANCSATIILARSVPKGLDAAQFSNDPVRQALQKAHSDMLLAAGLVSPDNFLRELANGNEQHPDV